MKPILIAILISLTLAGGCKPFSCKSLIQKSETEPENMICLKSDESENGGWLVDSCPDGYRCAATTWTDWWEKGPEDLKDKDEYKC